jgi:hypothetical protein
MIFRGWRSKRPLYCVDEGAQSVPSPCFPDEPTTATSARRVLSGRSNKESTSRPFLIRDDSRNSRQQNCTNKGNAMRQVANSKSTTTAPMAHASSRTWRTFNR